MTWTTPEDVTSRWTGTEPPADDDTTLLVLIGDAEDEVLTHFPKIQQRIDSGALRLRTVQIVVAAVVQRAYQSKQDGLLSYSNGVGPFSEGGSYADTRRGTYLDDYDIKRLSPPKSGSKAFSIDMDRSNSSTAFWPTGFVNGYFYRADGYTGEG
jgi:hypothetical protein